VTARIQIQTAWPWLLAGLALGVIVGVGAGLDGRIAVFAAIGGLAVVGLFLRPDWLPSALVATVFIEGFAVGGVQISRLMGPLAVAIVIIALATRGRVAFPDKRIIIAVGAYSLWALASTLWTAAPSDTTFALSSLALSLAFLVGVAVLVRTREEVWRLLVVTWAMSVLVGFAAVAEYVLGGGRQVGYTNDPNFFAATQVVALPIGIALASNVRTGGQRLLVLAGLAVVIGSVVASLSRGGLLALIAIAILLAIWPARSLFLTRARKRAFLAVALLGSAVLIAVSYGQLSQRTSSIFNSQEGGSGRENLWRAALTGWEEHPARGLGYGAFVSLSNELLYRTPGVDFSAFNPPPEGQFVHNAYLSSLTQVGVIGLGLFLALFAAMFRSLRAIARKADALDDPLLVTVSRALMISLAGFAIISIFLSSETDRALWVLLGLTLALSRLVASPRASPI
jgi:O-antigen ligase